MKIMTSRFFMCALPIIAALALPAHAAEAGTKPTASPAKAQPKKMASKPTGGYCENIIDFAAEARAAFRLKKLQELEKQVEVRLELLEAKRAEIERWLVKREEFVETAQKQLIDIYRRMRPDAAALQLAALDEMTAAAVILQLKPRTASTILNEMDPKLAARLASFVSYAAKKNKPKT